MNDKSKSFGPIAGVAGAAAYADVIQVDTFGKMPRISFTVKNTHATQALSGFQMSVKDRADGDYSVILEGTDWDDMNNFGADDRVGLSNTTQASIRILPAGEYCHVMMFIGPVYGVKLQAKDAGGGIATTQISGHASGQ